MNDQGRIGSSSPSRRAALAAGLQVTAAGLLAGCRGADAARAPAGSASGSPAATSGAPSTSGTQPVQPSPPASTPSHRINGARLIGDGSTSDTGPQPHQPVPDRLEPGQAPPQFVVFSWDGAGETGSRLSTHFQSVAAELGASMTFFLTGIYLLPRRRRTLYHPPQHPVGASAIPLFPDVYVRATIEATGKAWLAGHEIGTHFNGHFCGRHGVGRWSPADWDSEIDQAITFVRTWRTTTGFTDLPPLPFDVERELIGARTPCLEGSAALRRAAAGRGWRYDSSGTAEQVWPRRTNGLWDLSLQSVPFPGHQHEVLAMDYNLMANQSGRPAGAIGSRPQWRAQARDALLAGFRRALHGNRAPLVIGNHFEQWNGGIYMDAVEQAMRQMAAHPQARLVSFRQLVDWLEAQDPAVLARLQRLRVGQAPPDGWASYLRPQPTATVAPDPASTPGPAPSLSAGQ